MRKKPDVSKFSPLHKDPNDFLNGYADRQEEPKPVRKPEPTVQKIFRLRWDTANALKLHAANQSVASGKRVTETEIVEGLLREFLGM
jgi:hypothetical protein